MAEQEPLVAVMPDGSARHFTLVGSYPLVYYTSDEVLCPDCALKHSQEDASDDLEVTVYWEGANHPCDRCDHLIESAYGEVED